MKILLPITLQHCKAKSNWFEKENTGSDSNNLVSNSLTSLSHFFFVSQPLFESLRRSQAFWTRTFLLSHSFEFSDSELHNYQQFMWNSPTEHFAHSFSVVEQIIAVVNIMYLGLAVKLPVNTSWLRTLFYGGSDLFCLFWLF